MRHKAIIAHVIDYPIVPDGNLRNGLPYLFYRQGGGYGYEIQFGAPDR